LIVSNHKGIFFYKLLRGCLIAKRGVSHKVSELIEIPPLQSLKRGAKFLKVPLFKGDLRVLDTTRKSFQTTSKTVLSFMQDLEKTSHGVINYDSTL
jgi:hypothetical protein